MKELIFGDIAQYKLRKSRHLSILGIVRIIRVMMVVVMLVTWMQNSRKR